MLAEPESHGRGAVAVSLLRIAGTHAARGVRDWTGSNMYHVTFFALGPGANVEMGQMDRSPGTCVGLCCSFF